MSSSSRVPLLVGNKGRKPTRLPIAPRARPSNVDRVKRPDPENQEPQESSKQVPSTPSVVSSARPAEPHKSPERGALPPVLPVATPQTSRLGGISPGHAIGGRTPPTTSASMLNRSLAHASARSPVLPPMSSRADGMGRSPGPPVERLAKMTTRTAIPLFRPQEPRHHASPILGPRATPIPAPHMPHSELPAEQNPLLKRMARKLDIKPHQSPRRAALHQHAHPSASPLILGASAAAHGDVPDAPLDPTTPRTTTKRQAAKKQGTKRRHAPGAEENANSSNCSNPQRRSLRRKVKKENSYKDPHDSQDEHEHGDDEDYEQLREEDELSDDTTSTPRRRIRLPEQETLIYMPARERATLWAKKVLQEQEDAENGNLSDSKALVVKADKPIRRKRSNSSSSVASSTTSSRKSRAEELLKKEPSQMTMGELALSIPKGRRMARHEQEESAEYHLSTQQALHDAHRVRSMSISSETAAFGGSIVTPQVEIIDGKMVILESTVKLPDPGFADLDAPEATDDSIRRHRASRYLAAGNPPGRRWSKEETKQFYYCLSQVGPNFSMMATLFPSRKRKELKCKFKYEEKHHPGLIEIALKASAAPLDSEIVNVIAQMVDKEAKKKEAKRRKQSVDSLDGHHSPATVSSSAVPTPPPTVDMELEEDQFANFYHHQHERKQSFGY